jgi:hypothetical protein
MSTLHTDILAIMVDLLSCINPETTFLPALQHLAAELTKAESSGLPQETKPFIKTDDLALRHPPLDELARNRVRIELVGIAIVAAESAGIPSPNRDDKRTKKGMVDWFDRYWDRIEPFLPWIEEVEYPNEENSNDAVITKDNCSDD